ncbi:unnamed protein product [Lactuca saligna]|uniref:Uncharacterized protein n=1 Tax=Lactuca saligna TaxID=75948 RepID=A0AA35YH07_LACSI|nr:unnamed protein product [Lactuca saligna]
MRDGSRGCPHSPYRPALYKPGIVKTIRLENCGMEDCQTEVLSLISYSSNHLWLLKLHIQIFSPVHVSVLSLNRGVKEQENVGDVVGGGEWFGEVTSASKRRMNDKKNTQADSQAFLFNTDKKHGCHLLLEEVDDALYYYNKCLESEEIICLDRRMTIEAVDGLHKAQRKLVVLGCYCKKKTRRELYDNGFVASKIVPGAAATEIELARKLKEFSFSETGLDQYVIGNFTESFEMIPKTLAENVKVGIDLEEGACKDVSTLKEIISLFLVLCLLGR